MEQIAVVAHNSGTASLTVTVLIYVYLVSLIVCLGAFGHYMYHKLKEEREDRPFHKTTVRDVLVSIALIVVPVLNTLIVIGWLLQDVLPKINSRINALLDTPIIRDKKR